MKVIFKSDRKTIEFVDGITKVNANDVMWQFFKIKLELPLALRESLWITFKRKETDEEYTHPFLVSLANTGEYYAQIPAEIIINAGVWDFQLFIRQYSTTNTGKYVQYASNEYSFTVEQGLPVSALNSPVNNATIAALYRTTNEIIQRFYSVKNVLTAYAKTYAYQSVNIKNVTGCALIDWGDGTIEDANGKTNTVYSHTYNRSGNYVVRLYNVTNIGEGAFEKFKGIYDLELNNSLLSIGKNAFKNSLIDKLIIPASVEYLADCFADTDAVRVVELKQPEPKAFNKNAFKHFLLNLPVECMVVVPAHALESYKAEYITIPKAMTFKMTRSYGTEGLVYAVYTNDEGHSYAVLEGIGTATDTNIVVPAYYIDKNGVYYDVEEIGEAFRGNTSITQINFDCPKLREIAAHAFDGCSNLTHVNLRGSIITEIPAYCFHFCGNLITVDLPNTITKIADYAFAWSSIGDVPLSALPLEEIGEYAFYDCYNITASLLVNPLKKIGAYAFGNTYKSDSPYDTTLSIYASELTIYSNAFVRCPNLKSIYLHTDTPPILIDYSVFDVSNISLVEVPTGTKASYMSTNWSVFSSVLKERIPRLNPPVVTVNEEGKASWTTVANATGYHYYISENGELKKDEIVAIGVTSVYLENGESISVVAIGDNVIYSDSYGSTIITYIAQNLLKYELSADESYYIVTGKGTIEGTDIIIPTHYRNKPVQEIGANAFANEEITSVHMPSGITKINENAFLNCSALNNVSFPSNIALKYIGAGAFEETAITELRIPETVENIGAQAFKGTSIQAIDLPKAIQTVGENAFDIDTLKTVNVISGEPCYIGNNAFGQSVETITVPYNTGETYKTAWSEYAGIIKEEEQVINFELSADGTYYSVTGTGEELSKTLTIPTSYNNLPVKAIKDWALANKNFRYINLPDSLTTIGNGAFSGCESITEITIPERVSEIGSEAFYNCSGLKSVDVRATTPPKIGNSIFSNTALEQIIIPPESYTLYVLSDWGRYQAYFPEVNGDGGEDGGEDDGGNEGGGGGNGDNNEGESGGGGVVKPLTPLSIPIVTISKDGLAAWYSENATAYEFIIDGSAAVITTATQMQLFDGQSVKVRAVGDGIKYSNSAYSAYYLYTAVIYDGADTPILPEYDNIDITRNVFDRYALISELKAVNNEERFEEVEKSINDRVEKTTEANKLYGTDEKGNQTSYPLDSVGTKVLVGGKKVNEFNADEKQDNVSFDNVYDKNTNKAATVATVSTVITTHNSASTSHNDIRTLIAELSKRLNALADSDDITLDQLSEIVAYIKSNKSLIDSITTSKVSVSDVVNNLETDSPTKPLSAAQGVALRELIQGFTTILSDYVKKTAFDASNGVAVLGNGQVIIIPTTQEKIDKRNDGSAISSRTAVTLSAFDKAFKASATTNTETWTDDEMQSARDLIGAVGKTDSANSAQISEKIRTDKFLSPYYVDKIGVESLANCKDTTLWTDDSTVDGEVVKGTKTKALELLGAVKQSEVVASTYTANTIVKRTATGTINTNDPQWGNEAANRRFVVNLPNYFTPTDDEKAKWRGMMGATKLYLHDISFNETGCGPTEKTSKMKIVSTKATPYTSLSENDFLNGSIISIYFNITDTDTSYWNSIRGVNGYQVYLHGSNSGGATTASISMTAINKNFVDTVTEL